MAKKLVISAPGRVDFVDVALASPQPGQVLARSIAAGISHGTEMTAYLGTSPFIKKMLSPQRTFCAKTAEDEEFYPFRWAGYELVGEVVALGEGVTNYAVGDRVWHAAPHQTEFLFAEEDPYTIRLRPEFDLDAAAMLNLTSIALGAVLDAEVKLGDVVVIFGGGMVGQLAVQLAFLSGARRVLLAEPSPERRAFAEGKSAVETFDPRQGDAGLALLAEGVVNHWPDVVIECSGTLPGLQGALRMAGIAGRVIAAGFYAGGAGNLSLDEEFLHNRISMHASMWVWHCPSRWPERWDRIRVVRQAHHLLDAGRLDISGFVTTHFPFERAQEAYEAIQADPGKHLKVVLDFA